jgi:demethylmenaquinone methyltransferase/2-methoxy-6-polyprenyl-1,4-benzoquinol methylase
MPIDKSNTRVRRMFGEIAPRYDFLNHLLSLNVDRSWRRRVVRQAPPQGDAPILDVCTGTGDLALAYFRASGPNTPIVGADFCPEMLERAEQKAHRAGAEGRVSFVEADAQRLPFPSDHFQIVCVAFGLRNIADPDAGLREMTRVCQSGGKVVVLEFSMPRRQPLRAVYGWYFRRVLPRIGRLFARSRDDAYDYLPQTVQAFPEREALAARMQAAGLCDVTFQSLTMGVATLYVGRKPPVEGP